MVEDFGCTRYTATASGLLRTGKGVLHNLTFSGSDETTGSIALYDALSATGTPIFTFKPTTAGFIALSGNPDIKLTTGLYAEYTTCTKPVLMVGIS